MTQWKNKKIFVTGAGGFIGSHLVEALVREGASVKALVEYNSDGSWDWLDDVSKDVLENVEIVLGDVRDSGQMRDFVKGTEYGFHLAALISIPYSYTAPRSYVETNITGTLNVMEACMAHDITRLVCTSTSEVYGTAIYAPIDEKHPMQGQSPYSASKIGADHLVDSFYRSYNLPVVTLRPFNTYGPRQSMRAVIPTIIRQALAGDTIKVGNLTPKRDFNAVSDTIQGFLLAGASKEAEGQTINVGSGVEVSVADIIAMVQELTDRSYGIIQEDQRLRPEKSEVFRLLADISKAKQILGYEPRTSLKEGLSATIEWHKARQTSTDKVAIYHT